MATETTFEKASYKGVDYEIVQLVDSFYYTNWLVRVDENDGKPCWGKQFFLSEQASRFMVACMEATDAMLLGDGGSLYFNARRIYEGM